MAEVALRLHAVVPLLSESRSQQGTSGLRLVGRDVLIFLASGLGLMREGVAGLAVDYSSAWRGP